MEIIDIARGFRLNGNITDIRPITMGHINTTYHVFCDGGTDYVLQKVNTNVFKDPWMLTENVLLVTDFLGKKIIAAGGDRNREAMTLIKATDGQYLYECEDEYYRMYIYISDSTCYHAAEKPGMFEASARAFGKFQRMLSDFSAERLHETIPKFHDTVKRMADFEASLKADKSGRASECREEIDFILSKKDFCGEITSKLASGELPLRVTHNDTKLNNVMIDNVTGQAICVIDLDTVMPGSSLYDFGDSIRFGASTAAEDEKDLDKVECSMDLFEEYVRGFMAEAGSALTEKEKDMLPIGAIMMTLECGMRFLADYLDGDTYFKTHYPSQNLDRARTQIKLVRDMESKLDTMNDIVKKYR